MDMHEVIEKLDAKLLTHPHVVEHPKSGAAGKSPDDIPDASAWLEANVPFDDWDFVTYFGSLIFYFVDKEKAALFKLLFS